MILMSICFNFTLFFWDLLKVYYLKHLTDNSFFYPAWQKSLSTLPFIHLLVYGSLWKCCCCLALAVKGIPIYNVISNTNLDISTSRTFTIFRPINILQSQSHWMDNVLCSSPLGTISRLVKEWKRDIRDNIDSWKKMQKSLMLYLIWTDGYRQYTQHILLWWCISIKVNSYISANQSSIWDPFDQWWGSILTDNACRFKIQFKLVVDWYWAHILVQFFIEWS